MIPSLLSLAPHSALTLFSFPKHPKLRKSSSSPFSLGIGGSALSVATEASPSAVKLLAKPSPAEVSRTIMELSSIGTLSSISPDGWPLGIGARFVIDAQGTPALCVKDSGLISAVEGPSSFHVQLEQSGSRTRQCTVLGVLKKLDDGLLLKKLCTRWEKKYGEDADEDLIYFITVERVLQIEDFEDTVWVTSSEYLNAEPDPLRNFAEKIVSEIDSDHAEDVQRLCNVYVDSQIQATNAKLVWVDRLGFDLYIYSMEGVFAARVPFPREVTDEKGVKSSFNSMFHLAWEVEKGYVVPDFDKVKLSRNIG